LKEYLQKQIYLQITKALYHISLKNNQKRLTAAARQAVIF